MKYLKLFEEMTSTPQSIKVKVLPEFWSKEKNPWRKSPNQFRIFDTEYRIPNDEVILTANIKTPIEWLFPVNPNYRGSSENVITYLEYIPERKEIMHYELRIPLHHSSGSWYSDNRDFNNPLRALEWIQITAPWSVKKYGIASWSNCLSRFQTIEVGQKDENIKIIEVL